MTAGVKYAPEEVDAFKQKILDFLNGGYGRVFYAACQYAGVPTSTAYEWRKEDEPFDKAVDAARRLGMENAIDVAENGSLKLLQAEDPKHIRWFLETKGKGRGYAKRVETFSVNKEALDIEAENAKKHLFGETIPDAAGGGETGEAGDDASDTGEGA